MLTKNFGSICIADIASVGGKNASLGEMYSQLAGRGIRIPDGFATTSAAFRDFLRENGLEVELKKLLSGLDRKKYANLSVIGKRARSLILSKDLGPDLKRAIVRSYKNLCGNGGCAVAVRSSATAEDLPNASFAGQHDTFLNVAGADALLTSVKKCFASLYTDRAIKYREDMGFSHEEVALSVGVQRMVRADKGCSGVGFTIEPESGFENVMVLSGVWGLGENIVQGLTNPDEFYVFKPSLRMGRYAILQKKIGDKKQTMVYSTGTKGPPTRNIKTPPDKRGIYVLSDAEITTLAKWCMTIEEHYRKPMDIEWAKDGETDELFIIQARPETVHQTRDRTIHVEYRMTQKGTVLAKGNAVGSKIKAGKAVLMASPKEERSLSTRSIIITDTITPDWDPLLKKVGAIVTNKGGRTSHAAIVARELGVPAIVGCGSATERIGDGTAITVSCAEGRTGYIYEGTLSFEEREIDFSNIRMPRTEVKLILADPENAFALSCYPNSGVGLLRMEFIITHWVQVHPMALVRFDELKKESVKELISGITRLYQSKKQYFVDKLAEGIALITAAFHPKEVIVRLSDFKTNEYANLIGGSAFEPEEENPMLGFRGASRYYSDLYKEGFALECAAIKKVRELMGLDNLKVMVPFCRTVSEGKKVLAAMEENGLKRGKNGLEVYTMVEIPSNVIMAREFSQIFDGFSIGSNDLTQLTLGIDRDSEIMGSLFDENDTAAKRMISMVIRTAQKTHTKIGLCGQAPSDFPEFARFLVGEGIDSISFNPDALLQGIANITEAEEHPVVTGTEKSRV